MNRARTLWQEYRNQGAIEASQRSETAISDTFRARARLLSDASSSAQQAMQMYAQLDAAAPEQWTAIHDEIKTEAQQQRSALRELRNVLEPELLKSKLALLGDSSDDARQSPQAPDRGARRPQQRGHRDPDRGACARAAAPSSTR